MNFWTFPRSIDHVSDVRFRVQASSAEFLNGVGFDWNRMFRTGIGAITEDQESRLRRSLGLPIDGQEPEAPKEKEALNMEKLVEADKQFVIETEALITEWLAGPAGDSPLHLPPCNRFERKLLYQVIETKFQDLAAESDGEGPARHLKLVYVPGEKKAEHEAAVAAAKELEFSRAIGFRKAIDAISGAGVPIVGHNMLLDTVHTFNEYHKKLPATVEDFKKEMAAWWPQVFDTKVISKSCGWFDPNVQLESNEPARPSFSSLGTLYEYFTELFNSQWNADEVLLPIQVPAGWEYDENRYHEAGYDAFVTGCLLIHMATALTKAKGQVFTDSRRAEQILGTVSPWKNKINLMSADYVLNLSGPEEIPSRDHWFYLTAPPGKKMGNGDVSKWGSAFGGVTFKQVRGGAYIAALHDADKANDVMAASAGAAVSTEADNGSDAGPVQPIVHPIVYYETMMADKGKSNENGDGDGGSKKRGRQSSGLMADAPPTKGARGDSGEASGIASKCALM